VARSTFYYEPEPESKYNQFLMNRIDEIYTKIPYYGYPRITRELKRRGYEVNHKRIYRLMILMGIQAVYPKKNLSISNKEHKKYPYLLKGLEIKYPNQVWGTDITYIRMKKGFMYLVAIMDWYSRYVVSWVLSNSLTVEFCLESLDRAFKVGIPEIHNTDQGSQFTAEDYVQTVEGKHVRVSMDGRGRAFDNIFTERLWRSLKYEEVYLKDYESGLDARKSIDEYFNFYNKERLHSSLGYVPPAEIYFGKNRNIPSIKI
jgi:putative transposase